MYRHQLVFENKSTGESAIVEVAQQQLHKVVIDDLSFEVLIKHDRPYYKDEPIHSTEPFLVDGVEVVMTPKQIVEKRKADPKGRICSNCIWWDRETGRKYFNEQTHKYSNGSLSQIEEIIEALASTCKGMPLTESSIGYCPKYGGGLLCGERGPACDQYKGRPWLARVRNWWRLAIK